MGLFNMPTQGMAAWRQPGAMGPIDPGMSMPGATPPSGAMPQSSGAPGLFNMSGPQTIPDGPVAPPQQQQPDPSQFSVPQDMKHAIAGRIGDALLQMGHMEPIYGRAIDAQRALGFGLTMDEIQIQRNEAFGFG